MPSGVLSRLSKRHSLFISPSTFHSCLGTTEFPDSFRIGLHQLSHIHFSSCSLILCFELLFRVITKISHPKSTSFSLSNRFYCVIQNFYFILLIVNRISVFSFCSGHWEINIFENNHTSNRNILNEWLMSKNTYLSIHMPRSTS